MFYCDIKMNCICTQYNKEIAQFNVQINYNLLALLWKKVVSIKRNVIIKGGISFNEVKLQYYYYVVVIML